MVNKSIGWCAMFVLKYMDFCAMFVLVLVEFCAMFVLVGANQRCPDGNSKGTALSVRFGEKNPGRCGRCLLLP